MFFLPPCLLPTSGVGTRLDKTPPLTKKKKQYPTTSGTSLNFGSCFSACRNVCPRLIRDVDRQPFETSVAGLNRLINNLANQSKDALTACEALYMFLDPQGDVTERHFALLGKAILSPQFQIWFNVGWSTNNLESKDQPEIGYPFELDICESTDRTTRSRKAADLVTSDELAMSLTQSSKRVWLFIPLTYTIADRPHLKTMIVSGAAAEAVPLRGKPAASVAKRPAQVKEIRDLRNLRQPFVPKFGTQSGAVALCDGAVGEPTGGAAASDADTMWGVVDADGLPDELDPVSKADIAESVLDEEHDVMPVFEDEGAIEEEFLVHPSAPSFSSSSSSAAASSKASPTPPPQPSSSSSCVVVTPTAVPASASAEVPDAPVWSSELGLADRGGQRYRLDGSDITDPAASGYLYRNNRHIAHFGWSRGSSFIKCFGHGGSCHLPLYNSPLSFAELKKWLASMPPSDLLEKTHVQKQMAKEHLASLVIMRDAARASTPAAGD